MSLNKSLINKDAFPNSEFEGWSKFSKSLDSRIKPYSEGWKLEENYGGTEVEIPGHTNSKFEAIRYFEVIKKPGDEFYREDQRDNEICLTLLAHWPGYDHECEVNLFIRGMDVLDKNSDKVSAEIIKTGGAPMMISWNEKKITDFIEREWIFVKNQDKIWIDDMRNF